jgi:hypothetical protein
MRNVPILIVALCLASFADARPRRCTGGSCSPPVAVLTPQPQAEWVDAERAATRPFSPRDLAMAPTQPVRRQETDGVPLTITPTLQSGCAGGQCGVSPVTRFGVVGLRVFRR